MLMSQAKEDGFKDAVKLLTDDIRRRMLNSSVKLTGQVEGGQADGSGVILYTQDGVTTIVTAKHLLFFLTGHKERPAWDDDLVGLYRDQIRIRYDENMIFNRAPEQTANISAVEPVFQTGTKSWDYDVMIIRSVDVGLANFAAAHSVYGPNYSSHDLNYLLTPHAYLNRDDQYFFQTGYGDVREQVKLKKTWSLPTPPVGKNISRRLQYRTTIPHAARTTTVYNQRLDNTKNYDAFVDAIHLEAAPNSSTAPCDSGGPLFVKARMQDEDRLFVIGVTVGADMEGSRTPCPTRDGPPRVNNVSASLAYCYRNGLLYA
jgi:hypothetical protein